MIRNYLRASLRYFSKNKGFTVINIAGLSIGLAVCLLIIFYVKDELNYDNYNKNASRIYRITEHVRLNDHEGSYAGSEKPLYDALQQLPEIEKTARLIPKGSLFASPRKFFVRKGNDNIEEKKVVYTESSLFDVFTLPMIEGEPARSLSEPFTAVITASAARKYFNRLNVVGETMLINDSNAYKITGVMADMPSQSHFNYDFLLSFSSTPESKSQGWGFSGIHNYMLLKPGVNIKQLEAKIRSILLEHYPPAISKGGNFLAVNLTPLLDIHLRSTSQYELSRGGDIRYVYIFSAVALFILLIACVNFMNLSTARSSNRAKEVGVRKVLGSPRKQLIAQFLTESLLVAFMAALIAIALVAVLMPVFNMISGKELAITTSSLRWLLPLLLVVTVITGGLSGVYPAFFLSAFEPVRVLKGRLSGGFKRSFLRNSLVVFQFSISIFLIISTLVIYRQMKYIHNKDIGFNRDQVLVIKNVNLPPQQVQVFRDELGQVPGVSSASLSTYLPTGEERNITGLFPQLPIDIKQDVLSEFWPVDEHYMGTMDMKLVAGRNFSSQMGTDSNAIIVNEALVRKFGFDNPLDKIIYRNSRGIESFHIIGVIKDFNYSSLRSEVGPVALAFGGTGNSISLRTHTANLSSLIGSVENKWKQFSSNQEFTYSFMDDDFDGIYRAERQVQRIFISFSTLAILIACLGLFGLSAYAADQRRKEIAVRKVIGARTSSIVGMLSYDFLKLVFISLLIATPLGWLIMNKWLQDFSYRTQVSWTVIALAGTVAIVVALVTVSFQSIRAALSNPVKSLRPE